MFKGLSRNISHDQIDLDIDEPKKKVTNNSVNSKKFTKDEKKHTKVNDIESNKQLPILINSCNKYSKVDEKDTENDDIELGIQKSNISINNKKSAKIETFNQKINKLEKMKNDIYKKDSWCIFEMKEAFDKNPEITKKFNIKKFEQILYDLMKSKENTVLEKINNYVDENTKFIYHFRIILLFLYNFIFSIVLIIYTDKFVKLLNQECIHSLDKNIKNIRFLIDFGFYYYLPLIYFPIIMTLYSYSQLFLSYEQKVKISDKPFYTLIAYNYEKAFEFLFSIMLGVFLILLVKYTYVDGLYLVTCISGYPYKDDDSENDQDNLNDNTIDDIEYRKETVDKFELLDNLRSKYEFEEFNIGVLAIISIIASIIYLMVSINDLTNRFSNPNENDFDFFNNNNLKNLNNFLDFFGRILISDAILSIVTVILLLCFQFSSYWTVILYYVMNKKGDLTSYNLLIFFYYMFFALLYILEEKNFSSSDAEMILQAYEIKSKMNDIQKQNNNDKLKYIKNFLELLGFYVFERSIPLIIDPLDFDTIEENSLLSRKAYFSNKIRKDLYSDELIVNEKKITGFYNFLKDFLKINLKK